MEVSEEIVYETVYSGIPPIGLTGSAVYNGYNDLVMAFRTTTDVFTADFGAMRGDEDGVFLALDDTDTGRKLTERNIIKAVRAVGRINEERAADPTSEKLVFLSVKGTTSFLTQSGLYDAVSGLIERANEELPVKASPRQICVEFSPSVFSADRAEVKRGIADLKALGVRAAVCGYGEDGFPVAALMDVPFDLVFVSPVATALTLDRNRPGALNSLISFLHSLGMECVADGVNTDDEIRELGKAEILGVIPTETYIGEFKFILGKVTI